MKTVRTVRNVSEALRQSEERFRLLVAGVTDYAIFLLDPDGHVISWNSGAERIKGYTEDEIVGSHFSRFYPTEALERGWPEHELRVASRTGHFEDEGWRIRKDGTRFWANVVITALTDEQQGVIGFVKITRDLTERRAHEEALRQSEERLRLLVEGVQEYALFMLDATGHVTTWNVGAQRIKGYAPDQIVGQHFSRFYPREAVARGWPDHLLSLARRHGRVEDEGWRVRRDGTRFWAGVVLTALRNEQGELVGFAKLTRDLTERQRVEKLEREGKRSKEFLAMLGHELRNPLAPIRNAVAVLQRDPGPDARTWALEIVDRQAAHLERIVGDLLDVGRITTGHVSMSIEPVDMAVVVSESVDTLRDAIADKDQHLELSLPSDAVAVEADPTRLAQVVVNVLTNAHKYTPPSGRIRVVLEVDGRFAQLRVIDDGAGLSAELLPKIFDPFVQGARTLERSEGGLGIGLTLVRKLVELQGGTISASSPGPGEGCEFVVRFPLVDASRLSAAQPAAEARPEPTRGARVLIVDDNADAAESLAALVELWGHQVSTAGDGPAALEVVAESDPDLVLLDIGLPGMSGYEVAHELQSARCAVVALTGYGQAEDAARSEAAGCIAHLVKPVEPGRLQRLIREVLADQPSST